MPHIWIEYSVNLQNRIDPQDLVDTLHTAAIGTGIFPVEGIRTRAYAANDFRVSDGHPDNAFVHVVVRLAHGRDLLIRKKIGEALYVQLCNQLAETLESVPLRISLEIQELDAELNFRQNHLQDYMRRPNEFLNPVEQV